MNCLKGIPQSFIYLFIYLYKNKTNYLLVSLTLIYGIWFILFYCSVLFCSLLISIDHDEKAYKRLVEQVEAADEILSDKDKTINQLEQKLLTQVIDKNRRRKYTAKMPYNMFICLYIHTDESKGESRG